MNRNILTQLFVVLALLVGCVDKNDFDLSSLEDIPFVLGENDISVDINSVISQYNQAGEIFTFQSPSNGGSLYMSGYVISSDEAGNFFEELIIQNSNSEPTAGISIKIDVNPLYIYYEFGRRVWIKLDGLSVAKENGVIQMGYRDGNKLEKIPGPLLLEHLIRDNEVATILPMEVEISEFSDEIENLFIRLNDVQFNRNEVLASSRPFTFAGEASDEFSGERTIESCSNNASVILSTSTFSDFKGLSLPKKRGSVDAILTRDFFDDFYTIIINTPEDINFDNEERCDPIILDCGYANGHGSTILFEEDFSTQLPLSPITGNGWTNSIQSGTVHFEAYTSGGSNASLGISCRIGSYQSGDLNSVAWLISPSIDLDTNTGLTISFQTSNSFADQSKLEFLFSYDWDETENGIATANWGILPSAYIAQDSDSFALWLESGIIDLDCATGTTIYFAFRYTGSGAPDFDGTYEIDNIMISSN